ncbi:MAG TPA: hypothetical protein P5163_00525 [Rubrivivax sp.]|nr:hypothetical protein [Burkholderiaceae bacterium]HRZ59049.1 hypothetical protein [Rubrivivax sp.]
MSSQPPPRPAAPGLADDAAIPVLTERLALPEVELDVTPPKAPVVTAEGAARIEASVRAAALAELRAELPRLIEATLREELAGTVDDAVRDMLALLQVTLEGRVRQIVRRAVEDAIARLPGAPPDAR